PPVMIGPVQTNYLLPVPFVHNQSERDPHLHPVKVEQTAALLLANQGPLGTAVDAQLARRLAPRPEPALFNFAWLTAPGTAVFLTGTDAGSNALFGSLQKITATEIHNAGVFGNSGLDLGQAQVLVCTSNSTGGVMGKMIDAQSIVVATAATNQLGREADIFKAVVWHSILLASIVGVIALLQAYLWPFTLMVPHPP